MKLRKQYTCPLEITHDVIKGKWKPIIIWVLKDGKKSLSELERTINGISQKMLLEQLSELIDFRIAVKKTFPGYPLKVEYSLTEEGTRLIAALEILQNVGNALLLKQEPSDTPTKK